MIVLLHAYRLGFTAWQVAIMFTLYELAGVVTNLLAGLMGAKWGIKSTLLTGGGCAALHFTAKLVQFELRDGGRSQLLHFVTHTEA
jgi:MFS family permease